MSSTATRIGLIFGSRSVEREVSIMTASKVYEVLLTLQDRFETVPIFLTSQGAWLSGGAVRDLLSVDAEIRRLAEIGSRVGASERSRVDAEKLRLNKERYAPQLENLDRGSHATGAEPLFLAPDPSVHGLVPVRERRSWFRTQLHPKIDVAFPVIHGTHGEDGTIQGLCELADLPYIGAGVAASAVGMDKIISKKVFLADSLPTPEFECVNMAAYVADPSAESAYLLNALGVPYRPTSYATPNSILPIACSKVIVFGGTIVFEVTSA